MSVKNENYGHYPHLVIVNITISNLEVRKFIYSSMQFPSFLQFPLELFAFTFADLACSKTALDAAV